MRKFILFPFLIICFSYSSNAQYSVARIWNEMQLAAIRIDAARPPVQARNLFHVSIAMYDAWAAYSPTASTYLLGKTINNVNYPFNGIPPVADIESARNEAISYAAYRVLCNRYSVSPNWFLTQYQLDSAFLNLGFDKNFTGTNYTSGDPAELGNYIAQQVISMGMNDGANQANNYANIGYTPNNPPLFLFNSGNTTMVNVNSWQPLTFVTCVDQNGIPCGSNTPNFICPRWGKVVPFSMPPSMATHFTRSGQDYPVYYNPGPPPLLNLTNAADTNSQYFKWGHAMVSQWSSHLDPNDTTMWDISPNGKGNIQNYPTTRAGMMSFYDATNGGPIGPGYSMNPVTGLPYTHYPTKRGDYTRVVSQFWADGPNSETPPGHWYVFLNHVSDNPLLQKKIGGTGPIVDNLEWDIKSYFCLGGAMHDAAIACWGLKGWYDSPRPISMIRKMGALGQCSNSSLPKYHPGGLPLIPGYIEQITTSDPISLRGSGNVNLNKIKVKAWKGFSAINYSGSDPLNAAGVGWISVDNWTPYQRETFVTPPFAGYTSGHSTYSRAGALTLTNLTGSPYFPGGLEEYVVPGGGNFLIFETSPVDTVRLQWASYKDASDEASLSRIWGSIHPPFDDMSGRLIGEEIANSAFPKAKAYFENELMTVEITRNLPNPVCNGSYITFTAALGNTPSNVLIEWKKNGTVVSSGTSESFSTSSFSNSDVFVCEITGNGYKMCSAFDTIQTQTCPNSIVNTKFYIQGYYDAAGNMRNVLALQGIGSSSVLTDSVDIELHQSTYPYSLIAKQHVPILTSGLASATFSVEVSSYYIVLKHRNALETWSATPVTIGSSTLYDFSVSASNAFGENMKEVEPGVWAIYSGELTKDENIDLMDIILIEDDVNTFEFGFKSTDINGDGNVDLLDIPDVEINLNSFIFSNHP